MTSKQKRKGSRFLVILPVVLFFFRLKIIQDKERTHDYLFYVNVP